MPAKITIQLSRAENQGCTPESVQAWPEEKLLEWWKSAVEAIEVTECYSVADCEIRQITENELLRRDPDLELYYLYKKHFPALADNYLDC